MPNPNNNRAWANALPGLLLATSLLLLVGAVLFLLANTQSGSLTLPRRAWQILQISFGQAALSTLVSLSIGITLAWALSHRRHFVGRGLLLSLLSASLVLPTLVIVLGLISVFGRAGWISQLFAFFGSEIKLNPYGLFGIVLAHSYFNGAFAARQLLLQLEAIPAEKRKLVHSLGFTGWRRFKLLEWPALVGSLPTLATTIFLLCFTSFAIVLVLGGSPRYNTLEVAIYEALKLDFNPARAVALALLQLSVCAVLVWLANLLRGHSKAVGSGPIPSWPESRAQATLQWTVVAFASLMLLAPLLAITLDGIRSDLPKLLADSHLQKALNTSLLLASISSVAVVLIGIAIVRAQVALALPLQLGMRPWASLLRASIGFSATLYLAVPSLVLGLGFFLAARELPGKLEHWAWVALIVANVLMALPFALALLLPPALKAANRYDRLAMSLDLHGLQRWRIIEWPLLRSTLGQVAALSFCLSLGDLGVIALFGNNELTTLPWYLYQKIGSYRTLDAAGIALILLVLCLTVFSLLPTLFNRSPRHADT